MRPLRCAGVLVLSAILGGCGVANHAQTARVPISLDYQGTLRRVATLPETLGLMLPHVRDYRCSGQYSPAQAKRLTPQQVMALQPSQSVAYFWTAQFFCTDPRLRSHAAKGGPARGLVFGWEEPTPATGPVTRALHMVGLSNIQAISVHGVQAAMGRTDFGGDEVPIVWFRGGISTYMGGGVLRTSPVLVFYMGRDVPLSVLKEFVRDTHAL